MRGRPPRQRPRPGRGGGRQGAEGGHRHRSRHPPHRRRHARGRRRPAAGHPGPAGPDLRRRPVLLRHAAAHRGLRRPQGGDGGPRRTHPRHRGGPVRRGRRAGDRHRRRHRHPPHRRRTRPVHRTPGRLLRVHGQPVPGLRPDRRGRRGAVRDRPDGRRAGGQRQFARPGDARRRVQGVLDRRRPARGAGRRADRRQVLLHGRRTWRPAGSARAGAGPGRRGHPGRAALRPHRQPLRHLPCGPGRHPARAVAGGGARPLARSRLAPASLAAGPHVRP